MICIVGKNAIGPTLFAARDGAIMGLEDLYCMINIQQHLSGRQPE